MEDKYIGYLLGSLDEEERREFDALLAERPEASAHLAVLRQALEPLAIDRDTIDPPAGLAVRTIAFVAEHIVETEGSIAPSGPGSPVAEFLRTLGRREPSDQPPVYPWHGSDANPDSIPPPRCRDDVRSRRIAADGRFGRRHDAAASSRSAIVPE